MSPPGWRVSAPDLEALWTHVLAHWEDDRAHAAFLQHCLDSAQLGEAARRYRTLAADTERAAGAGKRLEAVTLLATSALLASASERPRGPPRWLLLVAAIVVVVLGGSLMVALIRWATRAAR